MADPTNVNVPPAKAADPSNINIPVHGTKFPSGVTGADQVVTLVQGEILSTGLTDSVCAAWVAPCNGYFRRVSFSATTVTAVATFRILNNTTSVAVLAATTPVVNAGTGVNSFASVSAATFAEGDEIRLLVTTDGSGALKGLNVQLFWTPLAGTTTNPV